MDGMADRHRPHPQGTGRRREDHGVRRLRRGRNERNRNARICTCRASGAKLCTIFPTASRTDTVYRSSGIDKSIERGVGLLLAVDCGVTAYEQVLYANGKKLDVIICDHHEPSDVITLPPSRFSTRSNPGVPYPYKHLCGCGVGFKLVQGTRPHPRPRGEGVRVSRLCLALGERRGYRSPRGRKPDTGKTRSR
jgi:hypothetical protein